MGSFIGHAIPGTFFFIFGIWWLTQVMRRHFLCRQTRQRFRSTATFPFVYCPGQRERSVPLEPIVKMVMCVLGIVVEIIGGINHESHRFDSIGNAQHITMYFFFALSGVLDLLTMKGWAPAGTDYVGVVIALLVEGALFKFHLYGRDELDVLIHTLLLYVIWLSVIVLALEAAYRNTAVLPLLRCLLTMLQGTWFWGVGLILYNPFPGAEPWEPDNHRSLMLAVVCFSWHVAVNLVIVIAVGGVTACCYRNKLHYSQLSTSSTVPLKSLQKGGTGCGGGFGEGDGEEEEEGDGEEGGVKVGDGRDIDANSDVEFQAPLVRK
ncbi:transmembrane protein 45B-like [Babylonia areolata]|uniref:transmembrane protein 45B-like n=1 Tax=Babylonia areolata TaxID=304850 RepID=UPI003FD146A2